MNFSEPRFHLEFREAEIVEILGRIRFVLRSGYLTLGPLAGELEKAFADFIGVNHAISCNSGSSALEIILRASGLSGKRVLVPANSNFATAASVVYAGAVPVFYDSGLYPNLADVERKLASVSAIVVVHIAGYVWPGIDNLLDLCASAGLQLIEDAAHAYGAMLGDRKAGTLGHCAAFSMFPSKVITTGEGGMITTDDPEVDHLARRLRNQGKSADGRGNDLFGNSWRLTELGAAVGLTLARGQHEDHERRLAIFARYDTALEKLAGISSEPRADTQIPSGYKYVATLRDPSIRTRLRKAVPLEKEVFDAPLVGQPVFSPYSDGEIFPDAERFCRAHVCLPSWRTMTNEDVDSVVGAISRSL
jgi:dTDP-4-amino-4,6-dideoxygalactose transaminase